MALLPQAHTRCGISPLPRPSPASGSPGSPLWVTWTICSSCASTATLRIPGPSHASHGGNRWSPNIGSRRRGNSRSTPRISELAFRTYSTCTTRVRTVSDPLECRRSRPLASSLKGSRIRRGCLSFALGWRTVPEDGRDCVHARARFSHYPGYARMLRGTRWSVPTRALSTCL